MKNVSSLKSSAINESPKTPGGISKSLLTPCRRVGLSRNWKKKGPSPFVSPLNSTLTNVEVKVEKKETRKRKSMTEEKAKENNDTEDDVPISDADEIVKTPSRNVELPRRKKSKSFLAAIKSQESTNDAKSISPSIDECTENITPEATAITIENDISLVSSNPEETTENAEDIPPPEPKKSTPKGNKFRTPLKSKDTTTIDDKTNSVEESIKETDKEVAKPKKKKSESKTSKTKSPNDLTKECIVVIQKKLLKVKEKYNNDKTHKETKVKESSQPLFDSDSDDVPLITINKKDNVPVEKPITLSDDDEFVTTESKTKKNVESKKKITSNTTNSNAKTHKPPEPKSIPASKPLQSSFDDDDDFFDKKKTIIIRKTYDKVAKPQKAKSTGSITQRDLDNLKARIEVKKKMLLARATTEETEELRSLIKRWQKGCQEALVELMDLMKIKCPDKHNMDYSEILQMLKIPPSLVGYDSDHDCFNTPDDSSAVLSKFNDI